MKNEEIVQALRCCKFGVPCEKCPVVGNEDCFEEVNTAAAELIERLSGEVEDLRRKLAMSDKDVTAAQLYFYQWQAAFNQLTQAISHIKDEDKAGKLCAALRAQLAAWGKTMEGTA